MSKNLLTFVLFSVVLFLSVYSVWRISQPRILSPEEMKVNGYYGYGSFQELRDFNLIDHSGNICLLYTSPSPRDSRRSRMPSSA